MPHSTMTTGAQHIELQVVESEGDRLDRWLARALPNLSRARVQKLIDQGHIQRNGTISREP